MMKMLIIMITIPGPPPGPFPGPPPGPSPGPGRDTMDLDQTNMTQETRKGKHHGYIYTYIHKNIDLLKTINRFLALKIVFLASGAMCAESTVACSPRGQIMS